jgi:protein TonB
MDISEQLEQALHIAFRRESPTAGFAQRLEFQLALQGATSAAPPFIPVSRPRDRHSFAAAIRRAIQTLWPATSNPDAEPQPFQGLVTPRRSPASIALSTVAHAAVIAVIFFAIAAHLRVRAIAPATNATAIDLKPYVPVAPGKQTMDGGGGGGDRDLVEVSKGKLPRLDQRQITPPQIVRNDNPKLAIEPTIVMPKNIPLPNTGMPNLGLPTSSQVQMASNGNGSTAGMGSGRNGGLGSGTGGGYGPGSGGGTGGGVYHVGGGVSPPIPLFEPEPEYTDEARRAKFSGIVVVSLIVNAQGLAERVHVVRALGMGLDEKAIEAVRQYKFKPAEYQGKPVPVEVNIEVNFQIY